MNWIVIARDVEQGEDFVVGPFATQQTAAAWAATDAEEKAGDNRHLIDTEEDGTFVHASIQLRDAQNPDTDVSYEWVVQQMVQP